MSSKFYHSIPDRFPKYIPLVFLTGHYIMREPTAISAQMKKEKKKDSVTFLNLKPSRQKERADSSLLPNASKCSMPISSRRLQAAENCLLTQNRNRRSLTEAKHTGIMTQDTASFRRMEIIRLLRMLRHRLAALPKWVRPTLGLVFEVEQNGLMGESCILPVSVRVIQVRLACVSQDEP